MDVFALAYRKGDFFIVRKSKQDEKTAFLGNCRAMQPQRIEFLGFIGTKSAISVLSILQSTGFLSNDALDFPELDLISGRGLVCKIC